MCIWPVHIDFRKHRKRHIVFERTEFFDRLLGFGFLGAELIAGKTEYDQSTAFVVIVKRLELRVLARENTLTRNVHNQQHRAFVLLEGNCDPVNRPSGDIIKGCWDGCRWQNEPQVKC